MYESKIEKEIYKSRVKTEATKFKFISSVLRDCPEDLRDIVKYLHIDELVLMDMGFSMANARHTSVFDRDIYDNSRVLDGLLDMLQPDFYDWKWMRSEFENEFNYTFLNPKSLRYCLLGGDSLELPYGMVPIDELETPNIAYLETIRGKDRHLPIYGRGFDSEE